MEKTFEKFTFKKRLISMLKVDFRRMNTMPLFYIIFGISIVIPILIFVMTSMVGESAPNPNNPNPMPMTSFENVWQALGALPNAEAVVGIDMLSMCNINLMYFGVIVLLCLFVSQDFRSGYVKNLFTMRSNKIDYVVSKTICCFVCGVVLLLGFLLGSIIGGSIAKLSFEMDGFNVGNVIMCMISKIFLLLVFIPIILVMSIVGKEKTWLSMLLAFGISMLLFMMIPSVSPLNSTIINVILSLLGGLLFSFGIGAISNVVLKKSNIL